MQFKAMVLAVGLILSGCGGSGIGGSSGGVDDRMLIDAGANKGEWLSNGRTADEQRFSPLDQITDANVGTLGLAWSHDLDTARGQEATPLMHDGKLYVSTAWSKVLAFDAASGKLLWSYDPEVPHETLARACCDAVNRGVALYGDKLFVGTLDGRLVALQQATGKVAWSKVVVPNQSDYSITGAPRIAKGKVLIGSGGAEYKARGYLSAYDAETGELAWTFHTVPGNPADGFEKDGRNKGAMEAAAKTWAGKWWTLGGGGTVWDSITYDPQLNLVYFGTGNAEPWNPAGAGRSGDSLYTSSIVAVNADTGEYAWHFQETPEDRWDFDSDAQITVADLTIDGAPRRVLLHAPKNGFFYVLDAKTGKFISGKPYTAMNWATGIDPVTGRPAINPEARYEQSSKPFIGVPGAIGAHSWQPMSFSPKTGLVYIPVNEAAFPYLADKDWKPSEIGFQTAQNSAPVAMPANTAARNGAKAATTGSLLAWDPVAQKEVWRIKQKGPWNGGTLATAGNLVFQGNAEGLFAAYSANQGKLLWSFPAQTGVIAAPMTYWIGNEQYVAVLAGWGGVWDVASGVLAEKSGSTRNISRLLVFKLGAKGQLAPVPPYQARVLDPPPVTGTAPQIARGGKLYGRYCSVCHGDAAVAGGINPDLRHTGALNSPDAIKAILLDGALKHNGMVSFSSAVNAPDAEAIRQYLISRANEDKALDDARGKTLQGGSR
jgi:alcohol dehydrogenase (cytochrome c)/quinohemoprotein ethanol dehydrogenase